MWLEEHLKKFKRILLMVSHSQVGRGMGRRAGPAHGLALTVRQTRGRLGGGQRQKEGRGSSLKGKQDTGAAWGDDEDRRKSDCITPVRCIIYAEPVPLILRCLACSAGFPQRGVHQRSPHGVEAAQLLCRCDVWRGEV